MRMESRYMSGHYIEKENPHNRDVPKASAAEYLAAEKQSDVRHEYVDGEIIAMAGASPEHNQINGNLYFGLRLALNDRPCQVYFIDIRVLVTATQYRYPDITAVCDPPVFTADNPTTLKNPSLIVEVLSLSTQAANREDKFIEYRNLESLTDYVLVAQDQFQVLHYVRRSTREWTVTIYVCLDDSLSFQSLNVSISLAAIYSGLPIAAALQEGRQQ
jgi:Uma2 family endonuclease